MVAAQVRALTAQRDELDANGRALLAQLANLSPHDADIVSQEGEGMLEETEQMRQQGGAKTPAGAPRIQFSQKVSPQVQQFLQNNLDEMQRMKDPTYAAAKQQASQPLTDQERAEQQRQQDDQQRQAYAQAQQDDQDRRDAYQQQEQQAEADRAAYDQQRQQAGVPLSSSREQDAATQKQYRRRMPSRYNEQNAELQRQSDETAKENAEAAQPRTTGDRLA